MYCCNDWGSCIHVVSHQVPGNSIITLCAASTKALPESGQGFMRCTCSHVWQIVAYVKKKK